MPWSIAQSDRCPVSKPWAVTKDDDGELEGCHETEADAKKQLAALYASESRSDFAVLRAPVEFRSAVVAGVDIQQRVVDVVAIPYNEDALVEYPPGSGKTVVESVVPGAFDGIDTQPGRVTVNRDHDYGRTIGITRALHPSRSEGLVAELRISPGPSGDDALGLAADGALGASVGMAVRKSDQRWSENYGRRHILRAFLDHIALVPVPAYAGARVLAVREALPAARHVETPNLDAVWEYLRSQKL